MNKLRLVLIGFSIILTACGQGFETNSVESIQEVQQRTEQFAAEQRVEEEKLNIPVGTTPKSEDEKILDTYKSEFAKLDINNVRELAGDIRSFSVRVNADNRNTLRRIRVDMHVRTNQLDSDSTTITACDNKIVFNRSNIQWSKLQSGNRISLGLQGDYEIVLQCLGSNCREMIAAVRRRGDRRIKATVLIGLVNSSINNRWASEQRYIPRRVDVETYFTSPVTPSQYDSMVCSITRPNPQNEQENTNDGGAIDPTNGQNTEQSSDEPQSENSFWLPGDGETF